MTITPETIAELRGLMEITSPLPWECYRPHYASGYHSITVSDGQTVAVEADEFDAELIAAAVNALPALLDAAERLAEVTASDERDALIADLTTALDYRENQVRTQRIALRAERDALAASVARVREGHTPYPDYLPGPNGVPIRWERCQRCNGAYPCQPIRALDGSGS